MAWIDAEYRGGRLFFGGAALAEIAETVGTPCYVYSRGELERRYHACDKSLSEVPHLICYAVKANGNLAVISTFARLGAGADIVTGGELFKALRAGIPANRIIFSGVSKTEAEIGAALEAGILMFNAESAEELEVLNRIAISRGKKAPISIRINPDVDAKTHPKITTGMLRNKFGIDPERAMDCYERAMRLDGVQPVGIEAHIGSQMLTTNPLGDSASRLRVLYDRLRENGVPIRYLSVGGGYGVKYRPEDPAPTPEDFAREILPAVRGTDLTLMIEPGRYLTGNSGMLLTRVQYRKDNGQKKFVMVDAGMNDLARPALYEAYHHILPLTEKTGETETVDVVGPICESSDRLAMDREVPPLERGDVIAFCTAGAYGFSMASNYNGRPRPAEVMIGPDGTFRIVRERETYEDLVRGENV